MRVILQRDFFDGSQRFRAGKEIDMDDALFNALPKTAKVIVPPAKKSIFVTDDMTEEEQEARKAEIVAKRKATIDAKKAGSKDFTQM